MSSAWLTKCVSHVHLFHCMYILTRLFQSYCLSLYGSGLWSLSSPAIQNIEVAFNKILRRIWSLSPRSHSHIVHLVANLHSLFNVIYRRSKSLLFAAAQCPSPFVLSFMIPLFTVSLSVGTIPCLGVVTSSIIILKILFVLL